MARSAEADPIIFWRPVTGGPEVQLEMAGYQGNPSIAGNFIAFESRPTRIEAADIFVYDLVNNRLFQITNTPLVNEQLNDITVLPDGSVRVVWASDEDGPDQRNIKGATFQLPDLTERRAPGEGGGQGLRFVFFRDHSGWVTVVKGAPDQISDLIALVQSFHLHPAVGLTLEGELWIARALTLSSRPGDPLRACGWLNLFIHEVQAQTGRTITTLQAAQLLARANQIKAVLGCN